MERRLRFLPGSRFNLIRRVFADLVIARFKVDVYTEPE